MVKEITVPVSVNLKKEDISDAIITKFIEPVKKTGQNGLRPHKCTACKKDWRWLKRETKVDHILSYHGLEAVEILAT